MNQWVPFSGSSLCSGTSAGRTEHDISMQITCAAMSPSSRKCHQVSGKGGLPQDLSSHPVTPFTRAPTVCKMFFPFSLTNLAMEFLENKLSLNKGFKIHPLGTCTASKITLGRMRALWSSTDSFFILNLPFKLMGKSTPDCTLCSSCFPMHKKPECVGFASSTEKLLENSYMCSQPLPPKPGVLNHSSQIFPNCNLKCKFL